MAHEPGNPPNFSFLDIHALERDEIQKRRAKQSYLPEDRDKPTFVGLALSGGGIRSATFCLGFLQGLHELRLLRVFDYLSTVSGGGYLGGWWSAWLSREKNAGDIFPNPEKIEPRRVAEYLKAQDRLIEGSLCADVDPVHHL